MMKWIVLAATHGLALALGFAAGIYTLPLLIAPPAPTAADVHTVAAQAQYKGQFRRDLPGSDALHWGEGEVSPTTRSTSRPSSSTPRPTSNA